nr:MAG TPA_asm: conidiation protein [Caudoviricetes sp.]
MYTDADVFKNGYKRVLKNPRNTKRANTLLL